MKSNKDRRLQAIEDRGGQWWAGPKTKRKAAKATSKIAKRQADTENIRASRIAKAARRKLKREQERALKRIAKSPVQSTPDSHKSEYLTAMRAKYSPPSIVSQTPPESFTESVPNTPFSATSVIERLTQLGQLRNDGVVTEDEFERLKTGILSEPTLTKSIESPIDVGIDEFTVVLVNGGIQKLSVIKMVRQITNLGLREAKVLVDTRFNRWKQHPLVESIVGTH